MDSIILHLIDTSEEEVASFLRDTYHTHQFQKGPEWIDEIDGDPCLYISFYYDMYNEYDPEAISEITSFFGRGPSVQVIADISGRHRGMREHDFARKLLTRFRGVAQDEYTYHLWTLDEINSGYVVEGHTFDDHMGWYVELHGEKKN